MFAKILVANRGEIAVRIIRACKEMGVATVAVYSQADRDALHTSLADESYCIGGSRVADSYLNMGALITVAEATGCKAVHPGYGLLSESAKFAQMCAKCGLTFIGPPAAIISKMGDKDEARRTMKAAGVPVINGSDIVPDYISARKIADKIGYPLLIKARSGGGGKGIRLVNCESELEHQYGAAKAEAKAGFGDGEVYLERFLTGVKHIEMQLVADNYGNVVCLGERDCSVQRNNQKLVEESPSPVIDAKLRDKMAADAVRAAKEIGYRGLGTIEFLLEPNGRYYFMEMNTRLQVEHPVTEMVTGIDLVKWQIRVAAGAELGFTQADTGIKGHAIECRINAEDSEFRPSAGRVTMLHVPGGPWVRFDTALYQGYYVPPFYDSMVGKLIVHANTREEAVRKMQASLCELVIEGISVNSELQTEILSNDEFESGTYSTDLLKKMM